MAAPVALRGDSSAGLGAVLPGVRVEAILVLALVVLALAVRLPYLWLEPRITDEWREAQRGLFIARGHGFPVTNVSAYIGALWNYILAVAYLLLGPDMRVPRLVATLFGALTILPTYLLGRELGGRTAGLLAGLLMATSPVHVVDSHIAWSHNVTPLFTTMGLWLLVGAVRRRDGRWLALAGLPFGLAFQTHPTAVLCLPAGLAYLWVRGRPLLRTRWLALAAILFAVGCLNVLFVLATRPGDYFGTVQERQEQYTRRAPPGFAERYLTNEAYHWLSLARLPSGVVLETNDWRAILAHPLVWLYALVLGGATLLAARRGAPLALFLLASGAALLPLFQPGSYYPVPDGRFAMPLLPPLYATLALVLVARPSRDQRLPLPRGGEGAAGRAPALPEDSAVGVQASGWARRAAAAGPVLGVALACIPLASLGAYYAGHAESRAVYGPLWETLLIVQQRAPAGATVRVDQAVKDAIGDNNTQRRTIFLLAAAGFDADYAPMDPAAPGAALADRAAVYLLSCPVYTSARQQLGMSPLDDAPTDTCEVLRAARYRAAA